MPNIPTVHLNGTSGKDLIRQMENACTALGAAHDAMDAAAPNGRDYYVQGPDSWDRAAAEHRARLQKLAEIEQECTAIWQGIADQMTE